MIWRYFFLPWSSNWGWNGSRLGTICGNASKHRRYPELCAGGPEHLVVLGSEIGGRWHAECAGLLRALGRCRATRAPAALRRHATPEWQQRWWHLLSVVHQKAVAATVVGADWLPPTWRAPPAPCCLRAAARAAPSRSLAWRAGDWRGITRITREWCGGSI